MHRNALLLALLVLARPTAADSLSVAYREIPRIASEARLSGTVVVEALVDSTGAVVAAGIARSIPALDDAAAARVKARHFPPLRHAAGDAVASLRTVPVVFETPPGNEPADAWAQERCGETSFAVDLDVRPDSLGRFTARWSAKGLKSQELYVIVLMPDGAVLDTTGQGVPQQLADGPAAPAWPAWHVPGHEVRHGASGTISFTMPEAPWWNLGRVAVLALFHDVFDNRTVLRQKAWRLDHDAMGPLLVGDPGAPACAAGPWRGGM